MLFWAKHRLGCSTSGASGTSGVTWRARSRTGPPRSPRPAVGEVAEAIRDQVRAELVALMHGVIDAQSYEQAEAALNENITNNAQRAAIAQFLNEHLDHILVHLVAYYAGLHRVTPEWYWRDFRLRLRPRAQSWLDPRLSRLPWSGPSLTTSARPMAV